MAKIDITRIDGFETMTDEQKIKALQDFEYEEQDNSEYDKLKLAFDKTSGELSKLKKEQTSKLGESERKALENENAFLELKTQYEELLKKTTVAEHKAELLAQGWEDKLATETAMAIADGDTLKLFANQKKHQESMQKKLQADLLKQTPNPQTGGGGNDGVMTYEKLLKLSQEERLKFSKDKPEEYSNIYNGGK